MASVVGQPVEDRGFLQHLPFEPRQILIGDAVHSHGGGLLRSLLCHERPLYGLRGPCGLYGHYHEAPYSCWDDPGTHRRLIDFLVAEFPEGWALSCTSCTSSSLRALLPMCPADVRVAPWCKTFSVFKKGVRPAYAWEPIVFWRGRNPSAGFPHPPPPKRGKQTTPKDFVETGPGGILAPITLEKGLTGAKPEAVCEAILEWPNVQPGDEVVDAFPGTGVMGRVTTQMAPAAAAAAG